MNNQNQNYESRGVSLTPAQWARCDRLTEEFIENLSPEDQAAADQINRRTEFQVLSIDYQMY